MIARKAANDDELLQVMQMQERYHVQTVGKEGKGFLTFKVENLEELKEINDDIGIIVLINQDRVVGYDILFSIARARNIPLYTNSVQAYFKNRDVDPDSVIYSAQYCIEEGPCRGGKGVRVLFEEQRRYLKSLGYKVTIGEVDSSNRISLACATRILKYSPVAEYTSENGVIWKIFERQEW
jgi:hypothetical protein